MAGFNITGRGSVEDYLLGRGCFFLSFLNDDGTPYAWREVGDVEDFTVTGDAETLERFTNKLRNRTRVLDLAVETSFDFSLEMVEWSYQNAAFFFVGETDQHTLPGTANLTTAGVFGFANVQPNAVNPLGDLQITGRFYDIYLNQAGQFVIGSQFGNPQDVSRRLYDLDEASISFDIAPSGGGAAVTFTGGTDFTYDPEAGHIYIPPGGALLAAMSDQGLTTNNNIVEVVANYAQPIAVQTIDRVQGATGSSVDLALKFVLFNAVSQTETHEIILHRVRVRPTGDISFLGGDELATIPLSGGLEANTDHDSTGAGLITIHKLTD